MNSPSISPRPASYWPQRFADQVVLVSGAAGGLGETAVQRLVLEGATVIGADLAFAEVPGVLDGGPDSTWRAHLDATDPDQWTKVVQAILAHYGRIDGLLLSHGAQGPEADIEHVEFDSWRRTLSINLDSCFLGIRAVIEAMKTQRYGRIVALSSISGREGNASMSAYSTSKAGVIALVKAVSKEAAADGVMINAVAPSMFQTSLLAHLSEERNAELMSRVPAGRIGDPAEFAALASWLLSSECSYSTGQVFDLSGGRYAGS